jgi:hypothetical protein
MHGLTLWAYHIVHLKDDLRKPLYEALNRHAGRQLILNVVYQLTRHNLLLVRILAIEHHTKVNLERHWLGSCKKTPGTFWGRTGLVCERLGGEVPAKPF